MPRRFGSGVYVTENESVRGVWFLPHQKPTLLYCADMTALANSAASPEFMLYTLPRGRRFPGHFEDLVPMTSASFSGGMTPNPRPRQRVRVEEEGSVVIAVADSPLPPEGEGSGARPVAFPPAPSSWGINADVAGGDMSADICDAPTQPGIIVTPAGRDTVEASPSLSAHRQWGPAPPR